MADRTGVAPPIGRSAPPLLEVREVTRTFEQPRTSLLRRAPRVPALRGVSFDVHPGERFGIVGESGSGKSTLLRLLGALERPTSGSIRFEGEEVTDRPERQLRSFRREVQMVFQDPMASLDPRMRVRDIVREPLVAQRRDLTPEQLAELLDSVGLSPDAAHRFPHQFSGGQRQRIAIARALSVQPSVLLADEPVSALDVSVRAQILNLLADLVGRFSLTLVFVSHDLSVVRHVCDTITVMRQGEIVESGPADRVSEAPQHPYTERLIASVPTLRRALAGVGVSELASGHLRDRRLDEGTSARPEDGA
jgi:ABC-type glutathione transport system ATPase component